MKDTHEKRTRAEVLSGEKRDKIKEMFRNQL